MLKQGMLIGCACLMAAPALASETRKKSCAVTAEIVAQAVAARIDGRTPDETKTSIASEGSGITGIYKATIPTLVDMVFEFEESTLGNGVVEEYETQCLNF